MDRLKTQQQAAMPIEFKLNGQTVVGRPDERALLPWQIVDPRCAD